MQKENDALFDNLISKPSKESTLKNYVCESTREEDPTTFRPFKPLSTKSSYLNMYKIKGSLEGFSTPKIHNNNKQLEKYRYDEEVKAAIKIQRFWRFRMLMRRKVHSEILTELQVIKMTLQRLFKNEQIQQKMIEKDIKNEQKQIKLKVQDALFILQSQKKELLQKSIKQSLIRDQILSSKNRERAYSISQIRQTDEKYHEAEVRLRDLWSRRVGLIDRQKQLASTISHLNKQLLLQNIQKSKIQLQLDQLQLQINTLKIKT